MYYSQTRSLPIFDFGEIEFGDSLGIDDLLRVEEDIFEFSLPEISFFPQRV